MESAELTTHICLQYEKIRYALLYFLCFLWKFKKKLSIRTVPAGHSTLSITYAIKIFQHRSIEHKCALIKI